VTIRLDQITSPDMLADAERHFVDRQAARTLASPDTERAATGGRIDIKSFLEGAFPTAGQPIPIGLLKLKRQHMRTRSLAFSTVARAASTDTMVARTIGDFRIEIVEDEDAVFVVVSGPDGRDLPRHLTLIHEERRLSLDLPLGNPIGGIVQIGLDPSSASDQTVIDMLKDPKTEIYLS